jgi:hypothetical protein
MYQNPSNFRRLITIIAFTQSLALIGCATNQPMGSGISTGTSRDKISFEEIQSAQAPDLYTLIQRLRPNFFARNRGMTTLDKNAGGPVGGNPDGNTLWVYVNETRAGDATALKSMTTNGILSVEYLDPATATRRFGSSVTSGVILVTRR